MGESALTRSIAENGKRCITAFVLGYLIGSEGGVSVTELLQF